MARRRVRTVGAVIVNPPRRRRRRSAPKRRRATARRRTTRRRKNPSRKRKSSKRAAAARKGWRRRKAKSSRRRRRNPARSRRRRTSSRRRRGMTKAKRAAAARKGWRRRKHRRNPRRVYRRRSTARRRRRNPVRRRRVRRNPKFVSGLQSMVRKIPFIGGALSTFLSYGVYGAAAIAGVEGPLQASGLIAKSEMLAGKLPQFMQSVPVHFGVFGAITAMLAYKFFPGSAQVKHDVALAVFSGSIGAAYYHWRGAQIGTVAETTSDGLGALVLSSQGQYGALTYSPSYGMGPAYSVGPQGYGAVVVGSAY